MLHAQPGSGLLVGPPPRWAEITAHSDDPASSSCEVKGMNWAGISRSEAIAICQRALVVTSVPDLMAPVSEVGLPTASCDLAGVVRVKSNDRLEGRT